LAEGSVIVTANDCPGFTTDGFTTTGPCADSALSGLPWHV
jgi:hypothetical protein